MERNGPTVGTHHRIVESGGASDAANIAELRAECVTSLEGIRALEPDYEHLYRTTANTLPFARQEWQLAWCAHFLRHNRRVQEQPSFHVVREAGGECVAIVPLILAHHRVGPLKVATVGLVGQDPALTEIRNPLVAPGYERQTVRAVHSSLSEMGDWDWIQWSGISTALAGAVASETTPHWYEVKEDFVLDLPSAWGELRGRLRRNIRESLRHCYNSLRRAGVAFEFVVAREAGEVRAALGRFLELHALRANMACSTPHPDRFADRSAREFLYDVCERLAGHDAVRVFQLRIGGEVVAARIGFVVGDSVYFYYSGFDPAWARYSVMTTVLAEALKYSIANGVKSANLSLTSEQSKCRWGPRVVRFYSALVHREQLSSRILCSAYRASMSPRSTAAQRLKSFLSRRYWH